MDRVRVMLEVEPHSEPALGRLSDHDGVEIAFVGMLQLLCLLEQLRRGEPLERS
jgi:hypothetical protein